MTKVTKGLIGLCVVLSVTTVGCVVSVSKMAKIVNDQENTIEDLQSENDRLAHQLDNLTSAQITLDILQSKINRADQDLQEKQKQLESAETAK